MKIACILSDAGWEVLDTGDGCQAYIKVMPDESYFLLTDLSGASLPTDLNSMEFGHYNENDLSIGIAYVTNWNNVLEITTMYEQVIPSLNYSDLSKKA